MNIPKLSGTARTGAVWGAGIFLFLWLGMYGTFGEVLLLLPVLRTLVFLGVDTPAESILWRVIAAVISAVVFSLIGARCGPFVFSTYDKLPKATRMAVIGFLTIMFLMIIFVGRSLRMH